MTGFTSDVMVLLGANDPERRKKSREIFLEASLKDGENLKDFIRSGLCTSLYPHLADQPGFVKQVVARALMDEVDWDAVAAWAVADPEAN